MNHENDDFGKDQSIITDEVTPKDLLRFAKLILMWIAFIFILSSIAELVHPNNAIFELCGTVLPSMVTLVIGFYFGKNN